MPVHPSVTLVSRISAVARRLSEWDSEQERNAHPWWSPRGLFFWWLWRPFEIAVVVGTIWGLTLILWVAADSLLGTDREIWTGVLACWVAIWLLVKLTK